MIELQSVDNAEQWNAYVSKNNGHPLQLWGWGQVKSSNGWSAVRLFAYDGGAIVGAAQILTRPLPFPFRSFSYIPRGPIVQSAYADKVHEALARYCKLKYRSVSLSVEPDEVQFTAPKGWVLSKNKILSAHTILLDLRQSEADLLSKMAKKTRQYIRKSATEITVKKVVTEAELKECLKIYHQTAQRAQFSLHKDDYYRAVFTEMGESASIFAAYENGIIVSFLWLANTNATAYEFYGGMNERGQQLRANYALKWHAITAMKSQGVSRYDFGGLVEGGVSTFKQGWGSETVFAGNFEKPLSPLYFAWNHLLPIVKRSVQKLRRIVS